MEKLLIPTISTSSPPFEIFTLSKLISLERNIRKNKKILINLIGTKYEVIKHICKEIFKWTPILSEKDKHANSDWNICWYDYYIHEEDLRKMFPFQKINHFPGSYNLGKKNALGKNLSKLSKLHPEEYNFYPKTYLLPYDLEDLRNSSSNSKNKVFIVKPEASCQGRGIFLTKKVDNFTHGDHCVVQEYVTKPYLIDGLKFDLRLYVMIKSICPLKIFLYREGLARFSTEKYTLPKKKNLSNMFMHLTNYAVNKKNPNFKGNESEEKDNEGHKRSFSSLLKEQGKDVDLLMKRIEDLIIKTTCSVQPYLAHFFRSSRPKNENLELCFEILGFDILLDENATPLLLEVNHTPSFATDSPMDWHIKKCLILDSLILMNVKNKHKKIYNEYKNVPLKGSIKVSNEKSNKPEKITEYENKNLGGYLRIYPRTNQNDNVPYETYMENAKQIWDEWAGPKRVNPTKLPLEKPNPNNINNKKSTSFNLKKSSQKLKEKAITLNSKDELYFLNLDNAPIKKMENSPEKAIERNFPKNLQLKEFKPIEIKNELAFRKKFRPLTATVANSKNLDKNSFEKSMFMRKNNENYSNESSFIKNIVDDKEEEKNEDKFKIDEGNLSFVPLHSARSNKNEGIKEIFKNLKNEIDIVNNKVFVNFNKLNISRNVANLQTKTFIKPRNTRPNSAVFRDENIYENNCKNNKNYTKNLPFVHYQENTEKNSPTNKISKKSINSEFCLIGNKCVMKNKMEPKSIQNIKKEVREKNKFFSGTRSFHNTLSKGNIKIKMTNNNNASKFFGRKTFGVNLAKYKINQNNE